MKFKKTLIRNALSMMGLDLDTIKKEAAPAIINAFDGYINSVPEKEGYRKAIIITKNKNDEYLIVKSYLSEQIQESALKINSSEKLDSLTTHLIDQILTNG